MAKAKVISISGPVNAKHIGGVSILANAQTSSIHSYFEDTNIQPDLLPSHTFVASGKTEVPRRSDTIVNTIRRPSVSLRRSITRLSRRSISHISELQHRSATPPQADMSLPRSESTNVRRPLRMQSSMSRLRQRVGLDKDLYQPAPMPKPTMPEVEKVPEPIAKDEPVMKTRKSMPRLRTSPSRGSAEWSASLPPKGTHSIAVQRKASTVIQQSSTTQTQSLSIARKPSPPLPVHAPPPPPAKKPVVRPKRADSGTAIDLHRLPMKERPLGFQEILAIASYTDRMRSYEKAREYWAHADHGLSAWTESAREPRVLAALA